MYSLWATSISLASFLRMQSAISVWSSLLQPSFSAIRFVCTTGSKSKAQGETAEPDWPMPWWNRP